MEFALKRSGQAGGVKEEKRTESDDHEAPHRKDHKGTNTVIEVPPTNTTERSMVETGHTTASSTKMEQVDELESARAEMGEVREENRRLKTCLERIMKEYQALQMQFNVILEQETKKSADHDHQHDDDHKNQKLNEESELVSLSLGRVRSNPKPEEKTKVSKANQEEEFEKELTLGLECKSGSTTEALGNPCPTNSSEVPKEEAGESWPPSKVLETVRERDSGDQDEVSQQNPAKKARVCVRARCDTPTMNDGCQWRKYGQKISKGNPCPRAYYRCTVAPNCPVRKQVQRCVEDMSILITTYEGTHSHPLPHSATAMASTTSAAASMLLSGSSSTSHHPSSTASDHHLHGFNFYLSDGTNKPKQFYLSHPALSPSPSHPTITLDLTTPNPSSSFSSSSFNRFNTNPPRFPSSSTSVSFSSTSSIGNAISWSNNGFLCYNNYNNAQLPYSNNNINRKMNTNMNMNILGSINLGSTHSQGHHQSSSVLPDPVAAATKVIAADPTFQSALAAALTSIMGNGGNATQLGVTENLSQKIAKWGDLFPAASASASAASASASKVNGCASSFLNKTTSSATTQTGNPGLKFLSSSLPFSSSMTASALSPADNNNNNRDHSSS